MDLRDEYIEKDEALGLFVVMLQIFSEATYQGSAFNKLVVFDETYKKNPEAILDIIKGGFNENLRYFSLYSSECDVVRVTGYLVKKSEMNKLEKGESVLRDTEVLGKGARDNGKALERT